MPLRVAIPDTTLVDCSDLRQKTQKIGQLARAVAVFRVDEIVVYKTPIQNKGKQNDINLLLKILRYLDTPQYLRKGLFSRSPVLKYAGILPPLRMRSHPLSSTIEAVEDGEIRWGIQIHPEKIDVGLGKPLKYKGNLRGHPPFLFRIHKKRDSVILEKTSREDLDIYFGYETSFIEDLWSFINHEDAGTRIAFSRQGIPFLKVIEDVIASTETSESIIAIFGGPQRGVRKLFEKNTGFTKDIDFWINSIPNQGTATVRLEEAFSISLALLDLHLGEELMKPGFY